MSLACDKKTSPLSASLLAGGAGTDAGGTHGGGTHGGGGTIAGGASSIMVERELMLEGSTAPIQTHRMYT